MGFMQPMMESRGPLNLYMPDPRPKCGGRCCRDGEMGVSQRLTDLRSVLDESIMEKSSILDA